MTIQEFAAWVDGCLETAQSTQAARDAIKRKSESLRFSVSIGQPVQIGGLTPGAVMGTAQEFNDKCRDYANRILKESAT